MVSHLELQSQLASQHRAPASISSRTSSRRHRQHRSHHGGTSHATQNEFPVFSHTGDTEIVLTSINGRKEQRYLLHRLILCQCSGFFDVDTGESAKSALASGSGAARRQCSPAGALSRIGEHEWSGPDPSGLQADGNQQIEQRRLRYVFDWGNVQEDDVPMLVQRHPVSPFSFDISGPPPVASNKPPTASSSFFRSMSNFSALNLNNQPPASLDTDDKLLRDYDNLFRVFYNYAPSLNSVNIADSYTECKALLRLAEMYDALDVVGPRIDHHLLRFGNRLFKQIAKYPPSYLKLGFLAQSKVIFAEALVHVVGQWPLHRPQLDRLVDPVVTDLVEDKVEMLDEVKAKVEGKLYRLTLTTSRGDRVTPSNSFLDWLAMSLFRQWLAENTTPAPTPILKDSSRPGSNGTSAGAPSALRGGRSQVTSAAGQRHPPASQAPPAVAPSAVVSGRIFRLLGSTNKEAYLSHDELKRFLKHAPEGLYNRENMRRFERRMDELKNLARDVVKPLTRNCLDLDLAAAGLGTAGAGLGYLTCTKVLDEDFPWDD